MNEKTFAGEKWHVRQGQWQGKTMDRLMQRKIILLPVHVLSHLAIGLREPCFSWSSIFSFPILPALALCLRLKWKSAAGKIEKEKRRPGKHSWRKATPNKILSMQTFGISLGSACLFLIQHYQQMIRKRRRKSHDWFANRWEFTWRSRFAWSCFSLSFLLPTTLGRV